MTTSPASNPDTVGVPTKSRSYLNAVLTANALLLGAVAGGLFLNGNTPAQNAAMAEPGVLAGAGDRDYGTEDPSGRVSAAEQRKAMIAELKAMTSRLDRIEGALHRELTVKVTSMPPIQGLSSDTTPKNEPKSGSRIQSRPAGQ